ncbi:hypothetical protein [Kitasatospora terrestris]
MRALVADLVMPSGASMYVMSGLETARELLRYSFYRYEFATVAVTHSLVALEQVLAERLAVDAPLQDLIGRAAAAGLLPGDLAAELDRGRLLRDRVARGAATSGALRPEGAVVRVRAVFDAVALLLRPLPAAADGGGARAGDRLAVLWEEHLRAPFPESFRGTDIDGVDLILLDADVAGLVRRELGGGLDGDGVAVLWACIAHLERIVPLIDEEYCASYCARLRTAACLAARRHLPAAS